MREVCRLRRVSQEHEVFIAMEHSPEQGGKSVLDERTERIDSVKEDSVKEEVVDTNCETSSVDEKAALDLQRVFRGHRTRRNVADAATMAQKFGWWNVVEGAVLELNTTHFYAFNKPQNAAQRWLRLKTKAAKVGKGLSKNDKARKLALQHWLEAIDPQHRYGHNLHFYYIEWGKCKTQEPFFYWLDLGEGKDLDLEICKRKKLQKELIRYLSPNEREVYEVSIEGGKLMQKMTGEPVTTTKDEKWIFVMSTSGRLYVGKKEKGKLQHSSFLAGGATTAAGRLVVNNGTIEMLEAHSGHYHPTKENFLQLISILTSNGADLTMAKVQFVSDDMLLTASNSGRIKEEPVGTKEYEDTIEEDIPATLDLDKEQNNEDGCAREVMSLSLEDEQNVSNVDEVKLMEGRCPQHTEDTVDVEIEGLAHSKSFNESGMWVKLKGIRLETINPSQDQVAVNGAPLKLEATTVSSHHNRFAPAVQTYSKLEGLSDESKSGKRFELSPSIKQGLVRWASLNKGIVPRS